MTQTYKEYLKIARLVAKRARLIKLVAKYPDSAYYNTALVKVSKELMFHQTAEEVELTIEDVRSILNMFYEGGNNNDQT